jgi:DNA (cytosine-5)-methyltransferase 3A
MAIKILIGGSPCTHWSIAQTKDRETKAEGMGWELFKNYLIAKEKFKPDYFLYENNKSASKEIKDQIAKEFGVGIDPDARFTYIDSALVSAQRRQRFYVTNFGDIQQPEDRGILLKDILETGHGFGESNGKSFCMTATYYKGKEPEKVLTRSERTHAIERVRLPEDELLGDI